MVPCGALYQSAFQLRIPRQQGFTDVPAREPLAPAQVIEPRLLAIDEFPDGSRNHTRRQRAAELVGIERHVFAGLGDLAHVFHKASVAVLRRPSRQHDSNDRVSGVLQHHPLGFQLGLAVDIDRVRLIRLTVPAGLPIEDFRAGEEDKGNILGQLRGQEINTVAFGFGDVMLMTLSGALLGVSHTFFALFIAVFLGAFGAFLYIVGLALFGSRYNWFTALPYGPYIVFATLLMLLYGDEVRRILINY